jgi:hypothetical protein
MKFPDYWGVRKDNIQEPNYIKLKYLTEQDAIRWVKAGGWEGKKHFMNETGGWIKGWWASFDEAAYPLPKGAKKMTVGPIVIIVHGRLFEESAPGYIKGNYAYITDEDYGNLF